MARGLKSSIKLSFGEEIGNAVSHGVTALIYLGLLPYTAVYATQHYDTISVISMSIFVISLFLMFWASTIYHIMEYGSPHKHVMRIIDHSMIFVAIAGSYTPIALSLIAGWKGIALIVLQWCLTLGGILYQILAKKVNEKLVLGLYLGMGWLAIFLLPAIFTQTSWIFGCLILLGGMFYSVGALFYAKKKPYFHFIWHLFIILASFSHYIAIIYFMN